MIANYISLSRILVSPLIFYFPLFSMIYGSISDFLDGYISRRLNQSSRFGAILDIVADKVFLTSWHLYFYLNFRIPLIWICIILGRDLILSIGILFKRNVSMESITMGKIHTALDMFLSSILLIFQSVIEVYIYTTIVTGIVSCIMYIFTKYE